MLGIYVNEDVHQTLLQKGICQNLELQFKVWVIRCYFDVCFVSGAHSMHVTEKMYRIAYMSDKKYKYLQPYKCYLCYKVPIFLSDLGLLKPLRNYVTCANE